ncbi:MAG: hypothetical protein B5M56_04290 [Desulfococcus sp. 4484_241]|nr:MAG: hypothetical protein B5M56_04290 [Desulfococcus sp. 4484_241]
MNIHIQITELECRVGREWAATHQEPYGFLKERDGMEALSPYEKAHLVVAAIRVLAYLDDKPPSIEDIGRFLRVSFEEINMVCRKLEQREVIEITEGPYGVRLFVRDHLAIEKFPKETLKAGIDEELERFRKGQKEREQRIAQIKAKEEERRKKLFERLNQGLKKAGPDKP